MSDTDSTEHEHPEAGIYGAVETLFRHRHHLAPDVLRSLASIWVCASAARYGAPHETFWLEDEAAYSEHDVAECESGIAPGEGADAR